MHNHSYENEFNLHVNEISFSYERMSTKTRFENEAKDNSEMAYLYGTELAVKNLVILRWVARFQEILENPVPFTTGNVQKFQPQFWWHGC